MSIQVAAGKANEEELNINLKKKNQEMNLKEKILIEMTKQTQW